MLFLVICFCVMSSQRIHRRKSIFSLLRTPGRSGLWPWAAGVALALVLQAVYSALYILGAGQSIATVYALAAVLACLAAAAAVLLLGNVNS